MNYWLFSAGTLVLIAFVVHTIQGDKELRALRPNTDTHPHLAFWIQARCGWHWVSLDLFATGIALILLAWYQPQGSVFIALAISIYFFCAGTIWLLTLLFSKTQENYLLQLGQWIFCYLVFVLTFIGR